MTYTINHIRPLPKVEFTVKVEPNRDVSSMYPSSTVSFEMMPLFGPGGEHLFQCSMDKLAVHHAWRNSKSRKDLMSYLNTRWVVKNHKKLYPEEYV